MILFAFIAFISVVNAQGSDYYFHTLRKTIPLRASIFYEGLKNTGDQSCINVDSIVFNRIVKGASNTYAKYNTWLKTPLFKIVETKSEADVIISGDYNLDIGTKSEEKIMYETSSLYATPIPYYDMQTTNGVVINIVLKYQYKDQTTETDTIIISNKVMRKPKKKFKTINELKLKSIKNLVYTLDTKFYFIESTKHFYKLAKIKIKDKALKEEYSTAKDLFKKGDITTLGNLYLRIYNDSPSKEAAYCLGACYEIVGNYPKAVEYYKQMPDFHTKVRMKNSMELYNYLIDIGLELPLVEF